MPRCRLKDAPPEVSPTPFSEFIRTAFSDEKKKLYSKVMKRASEQQRKSLLESIRSAPPPAPPKCASIQGANEATNAMFLRMSAIGAKFVAGQIL
jgi:hypothetical protein